MKLRRLTLAPVALAAAALAVPAALAAGGPFAGAIHGDISLQLKDGSTTGLTYDRGKIVAKTASTFTIRRADKSTVTLSYDASTVVREKGSVYSAGDLNVGEGAMFFSQGGKAVFIRCVSGGSAEPDPATEAATKQPGLFAGVVHGTLSFQMKGGATQTSTYDRGKIVAKTASTFTIRRADKSSVTLSYDTSTVVKEKGSVYSAGDLNVGEGAMFFSQGGKLFLIRCISGG
jgi:hypothetical protein